LLWLFLEMVVSNYLGWPWTSILLSSGSEVARITSVSHQPLAALVIFQIESCVCAWAGLDHNSPHLCWNDRLAPPHPAFVGWDGGVGLNFLLELASNPDPPDLHSQVVRITGLSPAPSFRSFYGSEVEYQFTA
jgi:hypothetical protein